MVRTLLSDKNLENKQAREAYYRLLDYVRDLSYEYDFSDPDIRHVSGLFTNLFVQLKLKNWRWTTMICEKCNKKCKEIYPALSLCYCTQCKVVYYNG